MEALWPLIRMLSSVKAWISKNQDCLSHSIGSTHRGSRDSFNLASPGKTCVVIMFLQCFFIFNELTFCCAAATSSPRDKYEIPENEYAEVQYVLPLILRCIIVSRVRIFTLMLH